MKKGIYKFCTDLIIYDREREVSRFCKTPSLICSHPAGRSICTDCLCDGTIPYNLQDVIPYVLSDWLSYLSVSILSPSIYFILVYFISGLREDGLASRLFTGIASVGLGRLEFQPVTDAVCRLCWSNSAQRARLSLLCVPLLGQENQSSSRAPQASLLRSFAQASLVGNALNLFQM